MTDSDVRNAAELLLGPSCLSEIRGHHQHDQLINSCHNSLSSLEGVHLDDIATGSKRGVKMSAVRRFFCCFVLFDLLLVSLIWLICLMIMDGNNIVRILKIQVLNYKITTSLFDLVMAGAIRFVILLLFYGILHFNTTFFVAFTTFATCIFLIFKVVYYSWSSASQPVFHVIIILMSFIVAWLEAWFFDFRVLPQEQFALHFVHSASRYSESLTSLLLDQNLRNPILRNFLLGVTLPQREESTGNYYSPLESADGSEAELDDAKSPNSELLQQGRITLEVAWSLLKDSDWKLQIRADNGDSVYSKAQKHMGKIFLLKAVININAEKLLKELFDNVDKFTSWDKRLLESRRLLRIDDRTDVTYQVSSAGGDGLITSRDFVNLRHWDVKGDSFVLAGISISYDSFPESRSHIRGENGPSCWVMTPLNGKTDFCAFDFLLNTNLKGWIPNYIVEKSLTSVLLEYSACLKEHCRTLNDLERA